MDIVDAHHHLWDLESHHYPWLKVEPPPPLFYDYGPIRRSYLIADYLRDSLPSGVRHSVHVQGNFDPGNPVGETTWLHEVAESRESRGMPDAVVAYADLSCPDVEKVLAGHAEYPRTRGIRQSLNRDRDPRYNLAPHDYLHHDGWNKHFALLRKYNLSFDLELYPNQMASAAKLAATHADTILVVTHAGMPLAPVPGNHHAWRRGVRLLARFPNVFVKISGFGMFDRAWTETSIRPFVRELIDVFGPDRCMFASNLPVDGMFCSPDRLWAVYRSLVTGLNAYEIRALFHDTAMRVYRIVVGG